LFVVIYKQATQYTTKVKIMVDITFKDLSIREAEFMNDLITDAKIYNLTSITRLLAKQEDDMQSKIDWHNRKLEMYEEIIEKMQISG
jgi:hypothetical protein